MPRFDLIVITTIAAVGEYWERHACFQVEQMQLLTANVSLSASRKGASSKSGQRVRRRSILWVVVEDGMAPTLTLTNLLHRSGASIMHLAIEDPGTEYAGMVVHDKGHIQRSLAMDTVRKIGASGPVWNLDSDLFWKPEILLEVALHVKPRHVYLIPVAHMPCGVEYARFDPRSGGVALPSKAWVVGWPERTYPVDMAGFLFHSSDIKRRRMWKHVGVGGESEFLQRLVQEAWVRFNTLKRWHIASERPLQLSPFNEFPVFYNGVAFKDNGAGHLLPSKSSAKTCAPSVGVGGGMAAQIRMMKERRERHDQILRHLIRSTKDKVRDAPENVRKDLFHCRLPSDVNFSSEASRRRPHVVTHVDPGVTPVTRPPTKEERFRAPHPPRRVHDVLAMSLERTLREIRARMTGPRTEAA